MKSIILISIAILGPSLCLAVNCPLPLTQTQVIRAAYSLESINGSGKSLTTELHSYSSKRNTWAVLFSYSGIQSLWNVETTSDGCQIKAIYK